MTKCTCEDVSHHVPNFAAVGFGPNTASTQLTLAGVHALAISACVSGSYNPGTHQICIDFPVLGRICFTTPIPLPPGELKVCGSTCGMFIPTGLKATVYVNNTVAWSGVIWGHC
jgi:hypothetical protein